MEDMPRNQDGTFPRGVSGNPDGRPKKPAPRYRFAPQMRKAIFEVSEMPFTLTSADGPVEIGAFKAILLAMAKKGAAGHAPSAKIFLEYHRMAASQHNEEMNVQSWLLESLKEAQAELAAMKARYPEQNHGVVVMQADGTVAPASWAKAITSK